MSDRSSGEPDIRSTFYDRYVSDFKQENTTLSDAELAHYYEWCDARYMPFLSTLPKASAILELGCGHGRILSYLRERGFTNASGIDISPEQIALANARKLKAEVADVFYYLESEPKCSCIIAIDFVEHFTKAELYRLFTLVHRALLPDGLFLIQTVNGEGLFPRQIIYGDLTHSTIFTPNSMRQLLRATEFHSIQMEESAPLSGGMKGRLRSGMWRMIRMGANLIRKIESGKTQEIWTENFITVGRKSCISGKS